jgi:phage FluMu protein Com
VVLELVCQHCHSHLTTDVSKAGLRAKCPKCRGRIQIPTAPQASVDDVVDAEVVGLDGAPISEHAAIDRKACPLCGEQISREAVKCRYCGEILDKSMVGVFGIASSRDPGWKNVRSGLSVLYVCVGVIAAVLCGMGAASAIDGAMAIEEGESSPIVLLALGLGAFVILFAGLGTIVGQGLCMSVPKDTGARGYAVGAFAAMVASVMFSFAAFSAQGQSLKMARGFCSLAGMFLFIMFIRKAADALGEVAVARSAGRLASFGVLFVAVIAALIVGAMMEQMEVLLIGSVVALVCFFVAILWFLRVVRGLRVAIDGAMR